MADQDAARTGLLLVEGVEDQKFFAEFLKYLGLDSTIQIDSYNGRNNLSKYLTGLPTRSDFNQLARILIVRDADFNTNALTSIQSAIQNANQRIKTPALQLPEIASAGQFYGDKRKIAALILPEPGVNGIREDVILAAFNNDPALDCITEYINCVRTTGIQIVQEREAKTRLKIFVYTKNLDADEATVSDHRRDDLYRMSWWSWDKPAFKNIEVFLRQLATD